MGKLYVMRHASTYYNDTNRFAGNQDIPLSNNGIIASINAGKNFTYENFDVVFTSALSRSFDTAILFLSQLPLSKTPIKISKREFANFTRKDMLPIVQFPELNERDYGILQNMDKETVENSIDPDTLRSWRREFYSGPSKGETFQRVVSRVAQFYYETLLPNLKTKDILIVAHQNTIRALYYLIYNTDKSSIDNVEFDNGDIWTINFNSKEDISKITPKNVIILAGGKGTRMGAYASNKPKPLLTINNKPIIEYSTDYLIKNGFNITIAYSYKKDAWNDFIKKNLNAINFFDSSNQLTYIDSFFASYNTIKNKSNYFIMLSGDMIFNYTILDNAIQKHIIRESLVTVVLNKQYGKWKKWKYKFGKNDTIEDIYIENSYQPYERYFVILNKEVIDNYQNEYVNHLDVILNNSGYGSGACFLIKNLIDMNVKINYVVYEDCIVNINDPNDLKTAKEYIDQGRI